MAWALLASTIVMSSVKSSPRKEWYLRLMSTWIEWIEFQRFVGENSISRNWCPSIRASFWCQARVREPRLISWYEECHFYQLWLLSKTSRVESKISLLAVGCDWCCTRCECSTFIQQLLLHLNGIYWRILSVWYSKAYSYHKQKKTSHLSGL